MQNQQFQSQYIQLNPAQSKSKINTLECFINKQHFGGICNLVCMEPQCIKNGNFLCCLLCIEELHQNHRTKSVDTIITEAQHQAKQLKPNTFNLPTISTIIDTFYQQLLSKFHHYKNQFLTHLNQIEQLLHRYFPRLSQQISDKNSNPIAKILTLQSSLQNITGGDDLRAIIKTLLDMLPNKQQNININETQLINNVLYRNQQLNKILSNSSTQILDKLNNCHKMLQNFTNQKQIWKNKQKFKFSQIFKHNEIQLINNYHIRSLKNGTKYSIITPSISTGNPLKTFHFQVYSANPRNMWIALGLCHKNILANQGYVFNNYQTLGRGLYMVSSDGFLFSHSNNKINNTRQSFTFTSGDIVSIKVDMMENKIVFKKKSSYSEINFIDNQSDQLHLCVMLLCKNDEVQLFQDEDQSSQNQQYKY